MTAPSRAATWGLILAAPAVIFVAANLLNEIGVGFLYGWIDPLTHWPNQLINFASPLVLLGGLGGALILNVLAVARLKFQWDGRRLTTTLTVEPRASNLALLVLAGLALATLVGYAALENFRIVPTHI